jgi:hypothetical protein
MCRPAWSRALTDAQRLRDPVDAEDAEPLGDGLLRRAPGADVEDVDQAVPAGA